MKPNKTGDFTLTFRVDGELLAWIDNHAKLAVRSRAQEIEYLIRLGITQIDRGASLENPRGPHLEEIITRVLEQLRQEKT